MLKKKRGGKKEKPQQYQHFTRSLNATAGIQKVDLDKIENYMKDVFSKHPKLNPGKHNSPPDFSPFTEGIQATKKILKRFICNFCDETGKNFKKCGRYKKIYYCSVACQKKDWREHKKSCC